MRMIALAVAVFVASTPAVAQSWEEYSYPEYAFSVVFPANPQVETLTISSSATAPCRRASIRSATMTRC